MRISPVWNDRIPIFIQTFRDVKGGESVSDRQE